MLCEKSFVVFMLCEKSECLVGHGWPDVDTSVTSISHFHRTCTFNHVWWFSAHRNGQPLLRKSCYASWTSSSCTVGHNSTTTVMMIVFTVLNFMTKTPTGHFNTYIITHHYPQSARTTNIRIKTPYQYLFLSTTPISATSCGVWHQGFVWIRWNLVTRFEFQFNRWQLSSSRNIEKNTTTTSCHKLLLVRRRPSLMACRSILRC